MPENAILSVPESGQLFYHWGTDAATPPVTSSPGLVMGGTFPRADYESHIIKGIGGQFSIRPKMNKREGTLQVGATIDTKALMLNALRGANAAPAYLQFAGGDALSTFSLAKCVIDTMKWSFSDIEAPLMVDFSYKGLQGTLGSGGGPQTAVTSPVYVAHEAVITYGGTLIPVMKGDGEVKNGVTQRGATGPKVTAHLRDPLWLDVASVEEHSVKLTTPTPLAGTPFADNPDGTGTALIVAFTNGTNILTLTYAGLFRTSPSFDKKVTTSGAPVYENSFVAGLGSLAIT